MAKRRARRTLRLCIAASIALAVIFTSARAADAHAALLSATPPPGAVLATSPDTIELRFSESVELPQQAIRLFDAARREIDVSTARLGATNDVVTATVPSLPDGGYVVIWRAVSADGHPISAVYTFTVGQGAVGAEVADALAQLAPRGASRASGVLYGITRAIGYAALATLLGAAFVAARLWRGAFDVPRVRRLLLGSGTVATIAALLTYGFQGVNTRAGGVGDILTWATWQGVRSTHVGRWLLARAAMLALTTALVNVVVRSTGAVRRVATHLLLVVGALVAVCVAIAGHASTGPHTTLAVLAGTAHVIALAVWVGGLVLMSVALLPAASEATAKDVTARFSRLASACVVALVATGTFMAWRQGVSVRHFTDTAYSRLLLVKLAVVAAMVAVGALSRRVVRAHAHHGVRAALDWRVQIRRTVLAEVLIGAVIFSVTAMLVNAAPPRADDVGPVDFRRPVAGLTVDVVIDPAKVGPSELHVYVSGTTTLQPRVDELTLAISQPELGGAPITVTMFRAGPAHFQSDGLAFPFAGRWTVTVGVRIDEFTRDTVDGTITVR